MSASDEQSLTELVEGLFPFDNLKLAHQSSLDFRETLSEEKKSWIASIPLSVRARFFCDSYFILVLRLYGEIAMPEFERLLSSELRAADHQVFVDLGSGSGKVSRISMSRPR